MEFIDHTGHIFSMKSYSVNPIGFEYETNPYIFWIDDDYTSNLSVNCYYIKPIRFILPRVLGNPIESIDISVESEIFKLVSGKISQKLSIDGDLELSADLLTDVLSLDDIECIENLSIIDDDSKKYDMYTFYIIGSSVEEGAWTTNVMIHIHSQYSESWCPISIGGVFTDEREALIINGHNMGIDLPKDILKAIYQSSFYNDNIDESLYGSKIKEYLLNFMNIKGECGNYQSAIDSLKWFGYGDHITISKLLKTDNEFINQFVYDFFNTNTDILESYKNFRNSTYVSLFLESNKETDSRDNMDFSSDFYGEGHNIYEDLFSKTIIKHYDEGDIDFITPYYNFIFDELLLKIAALKYYYNKYFLPIHLKVHSASIREYVMSNDMKFRQNSHIKISDTPILIGDSNLVEFPIKNGYYIYNQRLVVDDNFNRFSDYSEEKAHIYKENYILIDDNCLEVPINFKNDSCIYNCVLIFSKDGQKLFESKFSFYQSEQRKYKSFIILPKYFNDEFNVNYWIGSDLKIDLLCNDVWYTHTFTLKIPEFQLKLGKLEYQYSDKHQQINSIDKSVDFNAFMYAPSIALANDINFIPKLRTGINFLDGRIQYEYEDNIIKSLYYNFGIKHITIQEQRISSPELKVRLHINIEVNQTNAFINQWMKEGYTISVSPEERFSGEGTYYIYDVPQEDIGKGGYVSMGIQLGRMCKPGMSLCGKSEFKYNYSILINIDPTSLKVCTCDCTFGELHGCKYKVKTTDSSAIIINENKIDQTKFSYPVEPNKDNIISDMTKKQITELINTYRDNINVIKSDKYLNRICIYNLKNSRGRLYKYSPNADIPTLYRNIFKNNGDVKEDFLNKFGYKTSDGEEIYDYYLMHDDKYWYLVLISKGTINDYTKDELNLRNKTNNFGKVEWDINNEKCTFIIDRNDDIMLINRMNFIDTGGYNHFNQDDIIVASVDNVNFPYILSLGSKWEMIPMSIGPGERYSVASKGNTAIISIESDNNKYTTGYYNIRVNYSIDGYVQHTQNKIGKYLIEANEEI